MARIFETDSYCCECSTRVLRCEPVAEGFVVTLADELLYPGGGGQPADQGTINGMLVLAMSVRPDGAIAHIVASPLSGDVLVEIDWTRRFDHMQQHTAQHLITSTALREFGLRTTAYHIGEETCDIEFDCPPLSAGQLDALETRVNEHLRALRPVRLETGTAADVEAGLIRSRRLPKDLSGPLRIVTIEGLDRNTCGGTRTREPIPAAGRGPTGAAAYPTRTTRPVHCWR